MVEKLDPKRFKKLLEMAQRDVSRRMAVYRQLAQVTIPRVDREPAGKAPAG